MGKQLKMVIWIFFTLILVIALTACSGTPSSKSPAASNLPQGSGTPSAGKLPSGAPGLPSGAPGQPSGAPGGLPSGPFGNASGANTAKTSGLPDQTNVVVGSGTITVDTYANLYFGSAGQIALITVKQGDQVTKGTVLAKLDTTSLEAALSQAQVNLDQAKVGQIAAKSALVTAQYNLDKTKTVSDLKDLINDDQIAISTAQANLNLGQANGDNGTNSLVQNIASYQKDLKSLQDRLNRLLSQDPYTAADQSVYINGQKYDRLTVEDIQNKQLAVSSAQLTVDKSQDAITQAQKSLDVAQLQLNQATITAPFNGLVATVNQNVGDVVAAPAASQRPIIYMIDPATMELIIGFNELDMPKIKLGQKASVVLNAYPDIKIDGKVAAISPLPAAQGGIVNYNVTITFSVPANVNVRVGMNAAASINAG